LVLAKLVMTTSIPIAFVATPSDVSPFVPKTFVKIVFVAFYLALSIYIHIYLYIHIYQYIHIYPYIFKSICTYISKYIHIYIFIYLFVCVCVHTPVYIDGYMEDKCEKK
jgi:hypothetical protein